ncbi:unnamed protein product [Nesidiocoris tenuis]|uniref:Uncharacterized protein n=1 Tax=Nesidiocoris tenuis TaxID=355587 RepID=A0A6H5HD32_9HEMI|nr:unnamed protein product [Nesidiocoris tenuis]
MGLAHPKMQTQQHMHAKTCKSIQEQSGFRYAGGGRLEGIVAHDSTHSNGRVVFSDHAVTRSRNAFLHSRAKVKFPYEGTSSKFD